MALLKHKKLLRIIKLLIPILLLMLIIFEAEKLFKDFNWTLLHLYMNEVNKIKFLFVCAIGLICLFPMYFYDVILVHMLNINIPKRRLIFYSLSANTFSNFAGFGGVAGATLRTYFYRPYLQKDTPFVSIIAKLALFYLTGLSILCWFIVFRHSNAILLSELSWLKYAVWGMALYTPVFLVIFSVKKTFWNLKGLKRSFVAELLFISVTEWFFLLVCIWAISSVLGVHISIWELYPIVFAASCAGIVSMIPGGVGSFDLVILLGLEMKGIPTEQGLLILMLYRLSYYLIPVVIGTPIALKQLWMKKQGTSPDWNDYVDPHKNKKP